MTEYSEYKKNINSDVQSLIRDLGCQPVLFFGSGISRRYFGAPNWKGLLSLLSDQCPLLDKEFAYYVQSCSSDPQIASQFSKQYREWAWGSGRNKFDPDLFATELPGNIYIKAATSELLQDKCPRSADEIDASHSLEIQALQEIRPHSIITTNFDQLLELIFPDHTPVIGQEALRGLPFAVGELFKIHGCTSEPSSLVLTEEDYAEFETKKKFIAAKLLTLFNEHPLLICGYSASDPNIQALLADIDEALALPGTLIPNIYIVEYDPNAATRNDLPTERLIRIGTTRSVRVKSIIADDLQWVFAAFRSPETLGGLTPKLMRSILARSYDLVRTDIPRKTLKVNFEFLERALDNEAEFSELFGITTLSGPSALSAKYPHTITDMGQTLGGSQWHLAHKAIEKITEATGFNMKKSDNRYHQKLRIGKTEFGKYSDAAMDLIQRVHDEGYCDPEWVEVPEPEQTLL